MARRSQHSSWPGWRRPSLQTPLLAWAACAITVAWALVSLVSYRAGVREADGWMDAQLASIGTLIVEGHFGRFDMSERGPSTREAPGGASHRHYQRSQSVVVWDAAGALVSQTGPAPVPNKVPAEGFTMLRLGPAEERWRAFTRADPDTHGSKVTVLLSMQERDDHAREIAGSAAWPMLFTLPALLMVAALALRRGMRPLLDLSGRVEAMGMHHAPPPPPPHSELQPLVEAIERLAARCRAAIVRERELADTLAHELRTPLASLRLQVASLKGTLTPSDRTAAMAQIDADATRAGAIIDDLVVLARASGPQAADAARAVDLATLARTVVADHAHLAHRSGHQLGVIAPDNCPVYGHPALLKLALTNLLANALHHTPRGTAIEVEVSHVPPAIHVRDNANMVTAMDFSSKSAARLGLGHRIVQRVADLHDGEFTTLPADSLGWKTYTLSLATAGRSPLSGEGAR